MMIMDPRQSVKEEIRRVADIVEVIGRVVHLKKAGQNYLGLCPFHSEKTPSFTVSPSKQIFHCFGCKKGGDVFTFWMEYHNVSFPEAVRDLAERYQVSIPDDPWNTPETGKWAERVSLLKVNEKACAYFHEMLLRSPKAKAARAYLAGRGMTKEIVARFRLGYGPDDWSGMERLFEGEDLECAFKVGLVIPRKNGGYYDRFRSRIMFPIFDVRGRILGFGGRVLDDSQPKYMNTPESALFHKGQILYGLHASYEGMRRSGRAVIVEGYMDLLALMRHGFGEAVATLGTALSREHIRLLRGYAKEAVVVFDSDTAGRSAASKSFPLFMDAGFSAKAVLLPQGEDPDTFVNKLGLAAFEDLLARAVPLFDFCLDLQLTQAGDSIEGRLGVLNQMIPLLIELKNAAQQSLYVRRLAQKLDLYESSVIQEIRKRASLADRGDENRPPLERSVDSRPRPKDRDILLNILVHHPSARERIMKEDFRMLLSEDPAREIFDRMFESYQGGTRLSPAELMERLDGELSREMLREALVSHPICREEELDQALKDFEDKILKIRLIASKNEALEKGDFQALTKIPTIIRSKWG
jgi:DNA primase